MLLSLLILLLSLLLLGDSSGILVCARLLYIVNDSSASASDSLDSSLSIFFFQMIGTKNILIQAQINMELIAFYFT